MIHRAPEAQTLLLQPQKGHTTPRASKMEGPRWREGTFFTSGACRSGDVSGSFLHEAAVHQAALVVLAGAARVHSPSNLLQLPVWPSDLVEGRSSTTPRLFAAIGRHRLRIHGHPRGDSRHIHRRMQGVFGDRDDFMQNLVGGFRKQLKQRALRVRKMVSLCPVRGFF